MQQVDTAARPRRGAVRPIATLAAGLLAVVGSVAVPAPARAAGTFACTGTPTTTCTFTDNTQIGQFTVPTGVASLQVTLVAAAGGTGGSGGAGGAGGVTATTLTEPAGTVLDGYVGVNGGNGSCGGGATGGSGGTSGGFLSGGSGGRVADSTPQCSGGGGGGATFLIADGADPTTTAPILAAGGGGGGSGDSGGTGSIASVGGQGSGNTAGADGAGSDPGYNGDNAAMPGQGGGGAFNGGTDNGGGGSDSGGSDCYPNPCDAGGGGGGGFLSGGGGGLGSGGGGGGVLNLTPAVVGESVDRATAKPRPTTKRPASSGAVRTAATPSIVIQYTVGSGQAPGNVPAPPPPVHTHSSSQASNDPGYDASNDPAGENVSTPDYSSRTCDDRVCSVGIRLADATVEVTAIDDLVPAAGRYSPARIGRSNHPVLFAARDGGRSKPSCPGYRDAFTEWVQFGFTQPERGADYRKTTVFTLRHPLSRAAAAAMARKLQVCFSAPYRFAPRPGYRIALHDVSYEGVLPECRSVPPAAGATTPCVAGRRVVRSGAGWVARITFRVPANKQDPKALG